MRYTLPLALCALGLGLSGAMATNPTEEAFNAQRDFNAVQIVYRDGVPHTDRRGHVRMKYDPKQSFFPIAMWGTPGPGQTYGVDYDWTELTKAGFNTAWPWGTPVPADMLEAGRKYGLQIILMQPQPDKILSQIKDHPNLLGNVWHDEPIGKLGQPGFEKMFQDFLAYKERARRLAPDMTVFVNDSPWITPPATSWWVKWNTAGDVECHDNYPIKFLAGTPRSIGLDPGGIPQSVSLAVASNKEQKPVWLIVGAFDQAHRPEGDPFPFRFPTPEQLRACVYAGLIHGATGINYYIWDTYIPRDGGGVGISPNPQVAYTPNPQKPGYSKPSPATPTQLIKAKALWEQTRQINRELTELTPVLLSPTVGPEIAYTVHVTGKAVTEAPIRALLKPDGNHGYVLLTVNLDDAVLDVTYTFPTLLDKAQTLFENRPPQTSFPSPGKSFSVHYEPFDTHIVAVNLKESGKK